MMRISELTEKLEKLKQEHGDIEVEFQHCDSGGCYPGTEEIHGLQVAETDKTQERTEKIVLIF